MSKIDAAETLTLEEKKIYLFEASLDKMSDESKIEIFDSQFLTPLISGVGMPNKKKIADTDYIIANMPNKIKVAMINNQFAGLTRLTGKGKR